MSRGWTSRFDLELIGVGLCEPTCYSPEPTVVGVWPAATELTVTNAYSYEAVDGAGQKRRGLETAMNSAAVHATLEARGLIVLALQEADATLPAAPAPGPPPGSGSRDVDRKSVV